MAEAKSSGLRPPSKIGRACCAAGPKPSIPPSPPRSVANSMEHLWETHGRRLSEAGLRRGSDTSVVLTEDTDGFIIGDRVWVGGTKPGLIAYIGETQFAPGDWAGIVLDEPIGKNDGSVAGSRYFQCEPKRGVFSRLTRLTRQPISEAMSSSLYSSTQKTPTSPTESTRGNMKSISPSLNASTTSLSSISHKELRLGERVIVSSSQGSKAGMLRFIGSTEFAGGEWCGVELDDPIGKNDGSVGEKRYFECRPKYGLFAPIHKVSRSPSSKRTSTCAVHKPSGAALSMSLRKLGSRESLISVSSTASTAASTATKNIPISARRTGMRTSTPVRNSMQEMLKDKQAEIEHLLKERDLERERVTRAANQADQAEQMVILIKQEHEKYREDMEKKIQEAQLALAKLLDEKSLLATQLEEEHRKCEDLLFRFEEESLNKDDIQEEKTAQNVTNSLNENKIKELEQKLSEERERVVQLEQDSIKLFEAEEELSKLRSELSTTQIQDQSASEDLQKLKQLLEDAQKLLQCKDEEKNVLIADYETKIKSIQTELTDSEKAGVLLKDSKSSIQNELEHIKQSLESRNTIISEMSHKFEVDTLNLKKELEQSQVNFENIVKENNTAREDLISKYEKIVSVKENIIKQKVEELDIEVKRNLEIQKGNLEQLKGDNTKHIEELSNMFKNQLIEKESKIENIQLQLKEKDTEVDKLKNEIMSSLQSKDDQLQKASTELEDLKEKLKLADENNKILTGQIQVLQSEIEEENTKNAHKKEILEKEIADLKDASAITLTQLDKLKKDLENKETDTVALYEGKIKAINETVEDYTNQIAAKEKSIQELKLENANKTEKVKEMQKEIENLKMSATQKNEETEQLSRKYIELENKHSISENVKSSLDANVQTLTSTIADLNGKLTTAEEKTSLLIEQKKKLELDISNLISSSADSSDQLVKYNEDLRNKEQELDEARDKVGKLQNSLNSIENQLQTTQQQLEKSQSLNKELSLKISEVEGMFVTEKKLKEDLSLEISVFQNRERELVETVNKDKDLSIDLEKKINEISELTAQLGSCRQEILELKDRNLQLQRLYDEILEKTNKEKISNEKIVQELETRLEEFSQELKILHQSKQKLENELNGREQSITELAQKLNSEVDSKADLNKILIETNSKLSQNESKIQSLEGEKNHLDSNLKDINTKYNNCLTEIALLKSANDNSASEAQMKLVTVEKQLANITTETETLNNSLVEINKLHNELNIKFTDATENNKSLVNKVAEIEKTIKAKDDIISELNNEITSAKEQHKISRSEVTKLNDELKSNQLELTSVLDEKGVFQETIKTLKGQLLDMQSNLSLKNVAEQELIMKLENLTKMQEKSLHDVATSKDTEIENLHTEIKIVTLKNVELSTNIETLKNLIKEKDTKFNENEKIIEKLNAQIKHADGKDAEKLTTIEETRMKLTSQQLELDNISKQNIDLRKAKESLETLLQEKEKSIGALEESLNSRDTEDTLKTKEFTDKLNLASAESTQLREALSLLKNELQQVNEKWSQAKEALKLASQNHKNLQEVGVVSNNQSIHAAGGDMTEHKNKSGTNVDTENLLTEYELARGQIEFLNSIIVDMKQKNDALTCKVEVLEMGIPPGEADDYNLNSINSRMAAPRMFCDICDQFDLHDTEDCPRQAQDSPEPEISPRTPKKVQAERPYCDVCEAFGHDTADCDDGETF